MRLLVIGLLLLGSVSPAFSDGLPLTTKQVSLMLRSGYSSETVMKELATHHFGDAFDATVETQLKKAGASPVLIDAIRNGSFQASASEIAAAEEKLAAQEENTNDPQEPSQPKPKVTAPVQRPNSLPPRSTVNEVYRLLKGDLVSAHQGAVTRFDDDGIEKKKYFLFFFSANWSPAGRKLTPQLVEYYNRTQPQHPEFEVIFFSADRSQFGMETYLQQNNMPWPAVAYPKISSKAAAMETKSITNIPCLMLIDAGGHILSQNSADKTPEQVLADVDKVLAGTHPAQIARTR